MTRFADPAAAGEQLAPLIDVDAAVVLAVLTSGVLVALPIGAALGVPVQPLPVARTEAGPVVGPVPDVAGRVVVVVDIGVETGAVALAVAAAIRATSPAGLVLAVPVCPRDAMPRLATVYDRVIALDMPFGRRSLAWHYDDLREIDDDGAMALLAAQ